MAQPVPAGILHHIRDGIRRLVEKCFYIRMLQEPFRVRCGGHPTLHRAKVDHVCTTIGASADLVGRVIRAGGFGGGADGCDVRAVG